MVGQDFDVIVIGTGMAGLTAARQIAKHGLRVLAVSRGLGATSVSSGVIDILGYISDENGSKIVLNPKKGVWEIAFRYPQHPYGIIGGGLEVEGEERADRCLNTLSKAITFFKIEGKKYTPEYLGEIDENILVMNTIGTFKPTCLAPSTMCPGNLRLFRNARVLFVGFRGFPDFNPIYVSRSVSYLRSNLHKICRISIESVDSAYSHLSTFEGRRNIESFELARALDREEISKEMVHRLKNLTDKKNLTHIALPIAGMNRSGENLKNIREETGLETFELPSVPPSVAGYRLQKLLERNARRSGVHILKSHKITKVKVQDGVCNSVVMESLLRKRVSKYSAKAFVLATGDLIAGGLISDERVIREPLFNLAIPQIGRAKADDYTSWLVSQPFPACGHPYARLGINVDNNLRVIHERGAIKNVYGAGAILSGFDYSVEKNGFGVCLATGHVAGENAIDFVRHEGG